MTWQAWLLAPARALHAALMPDYNRKATLYWWSIVALGIAALLHAVATVATMPTDALVQVTVGAAIALLAGCFPVRVGRSKSAFAAGEVFIFLLLLLHGPAAATVAACCETAIGAFRTSSRWTSRIASPAISALSMLATGSLLQVLLSALAARGATNAGLTIAATMAAAVVFFMANTLLVAAVPRLKRNEPPQWADLLNVFGWVGIAIAGSGALAALLFLSYRQSGLGVLMAVVPIMGTLLAALHYYRGQQETHEAMREAAAQAAEREAEARAAAAAREAELAAQHLRQLEASERRFHSAFTHASIGMALMSVDGRILQANAALRSLLGRADEQLRGHDLREFAGEADRCALHSGLARMTDHGCETFALEMRCRGAAGAEVWVAAHCSFFSEPGASTPCLILQLQDITARRKAEAGLHQLAFNDSLTGLPNRRRFGELLAQAVAGAQQDASQGFAVMFFDFDRFKLVNDTLGHAAGDEFLIQVSRRIRDSVRPADAVARLGGDEFAVLAYRVQHERDVLTLADRTLQALRQPITVAGSELTASASIGITTSAFGYACADDVLRDADIAMYRAKTTGKGRYALFDKTLHAELTQRVRLEADLRRAIDNDQLSLHYQPLYDLTNSRLIGLEALARWVHPELGPIGPDTFIPIAEETGLIAPLTDFVLHRACSQLRQWQRSDPSCAKLTVNVNISAKDVGHTGLVARITHALVASRLEPQYLTIELTESTLMERLDVALPMLQELRALGVGLAVDDFGTGYSSLAHLSTLPVDSLKVDRSFIRDLRSDTREAAVVRAVVNLGHSLGKVVVAEGIETASQFAQLRDMGCQAGQGYHLSRPLPATGIEELLRTRRPEGRTLRVVNGSAQVIQLH
jgi:diguanylate cyclase (GGDEF)-like protein/PAS domain S-box-containing protein